MNKTKKKIKISSTLDVATGVKHLTAFPWDFADESFSEINCTGVFEYIPAKLRGKFMDEIFRILAPDGKMAMTVPYFTSWIAIHDFRIEWPPLSEQSFLLFNKVWRETNKKDLKLKCDFDYTYGYTAEAEVAARNDETRSMQIKYYNNTVQSLHLMFTKRPIK
jgi:SAM-dependent methyltransferase